MRPSLQATLLALSLTSCTCQEEPVFAPDLGDDGGRGIDDASDGADRLAPGDGGAVRGDGGQTDAGSRAEYCAGDGPPIIATNRGGTRVDVCTGEIAQTTFRFAICSCESPVGTSELFTDAFDSSLGTYTPGGRGGAFGTNASYTATSRWLIGGAVFAAGTGQVTTTGEQTYLGELHVAADLNVNTMSVDRDAFVGGSITASELDIAGALHQSAGANQTGDITAMSVIREPVVVPQPCGCEPNQLVDIDGFIEAGRTRNDNAEVGLSPEVLSDINTSTVVTLPCGRFYLSEITGTADITVRITGRTALFVGGDFRTTQRLRLELAPGAEVDVFVAGSFIATGRLELGSRDAPSKARLYVGGEETIVLTAQALVAGNIYAPRAQVTITGALEVFGSLFARKLTFTQALRVHYDRSILTAGDECSPTGTEPTDGGVVAGDSGRPEPTETCETCNDCGNQACVGGVCGACTSSSDCCAPLVCVQGVCLPDF